MTKLPTHSGTKSPGTIYLIIGFHIICKLPSSYIIAKVELANGDFSLMQINREQRRCHTAKPPQPPITSHNLGDPISEKASMPIHATIQTLPRFSLVSN